VKAHDALAFIVKELVDHPDDVEIEEVEDDQGVVLELRVTPRTSARSSGSVVGRRRRCVRSSAPPVRSTTRT
jgi:predicted RNA-binding protein YlqC (UPF0109 family)